MLRFHRLRAPTKITAIIAIYRVLIEVVAKMERLFRRLLGRDNAHIRRVCCDYYVVKNARKSLLLQFLLVL